MLAKKFLIPLLTLGVIGGSSGAIYYSVNKENDQKIAKDFSSPVDIPKNNEDINGQQVEQVDSNEDGKDGKVGEGKNAIQVSTEDGTEEKNKILLPIDQKIQPEIKSDVGTFVDNELNTESIPALKVVSKNTASSDHGELSDKQEIQQEVTFENTDEVVDAEEDDDSRI